MSAGATEEKQITDARQEAPVAARRLRAATAADLHQAFGD
jgi:hypothetical protein